MHEFGALPDELPEYRLEPDARIERKQSAGRYERLLTVAAVYLAGNQDLPAGRKIPVTRQHIRDTAEALLIPKGQSEIPWLNDLVDLVRFQSCFLSHSTKDRTFCERLYRDLTQNGVSCWYFPESATWGESVWKEINRGIDMYDRLLVVCSRNSLTSWPVLRELERALQREDEDRRCGRASQILFPITIDDFVFVSWEHERAADVRAKVIGDFRGCERRCPKYRSALTTLLQSLPAREAGKD